MPDIGEPSECGKTLTVMLRRSSEEAAKTDLKDGFCLRDWQVLPREGLLRSGSEVRYLAPQLMDILVYFARHSGRVVSKPELLDAVWPDTAVEEGALARCVSELRSALGDNARQPRFLRTVVKRGYQLLPPVEPLARPAAVEDVGSDSVVSSALPTVARAASAAHRLAAVALGMLSLILIDGSGLGSWQPDSDRPPVSELLSSGPRSALAVLAIDATSISIGASGAPDQDWVSTALEEMLAADLAFSEDLRVVPAARVAEVRRELTIGDDPSVSAQQHLLTTFGVDYGVVGMLRPAPPSQPIPAQSIPTYSTPTQAGNSRVAGPVRLDLRLVSRDLEKEARVVETGDLNALEDLSLLAGIRLRELVRAQADLTTEHWLDSPPRPADRAAAELRYRGLAAFRRFDPGLGIELLERSLRGPVRTDRRADPWTHHTLAQALGSLGREAEAETAAAEALALAGDLLAADLWSLEAAGHGLAGRWEAAVARYRELFRIERETLENGLALARAQLSAGAPEAARSTLAAVQRAAPPDHVDPRFEVVAAEASLALGDYRQALAEASRGLSLAEDRVARRVVATARALQARALSHLGGLERAQAAAAAAARDFAAVGDRTGELEAQAVLATLLEQEGEIAEAERAEREVLAGARAIGSVRLESRVLPRLARHLWNAGDPRRAEELFQSSIALRRAAGDRPGVASLLSEYAGMTAIHGTREQAGEIYQQALAIYRDLGDLERASATLVRVGRQALIQGEVIRAIPALKEAERIQRQLGQESALVNTLLNLGYARAYTGEIDLALEAFEGCVTLSRASRPSMLAVGLEGLGFARLLAGDTEGAENAYRASLSHLTAPWLRARVLVGLAGAHLAAGRLGEAERTAGAAVSTAEVSGYLPAQLAAHGRWTEVLFTQGRIAEARREIRSMSHSPFPADYWTLGVLLREIAVARVTGGTGDARRARQVLDQTARFARRTGAETVALEASFARFEIARPTPGDRSVLRAELAALEERAGSLGLAWLERRAQDLASAEVWSPGQGELRSGSSPRASR